MTRANFKGFVIFLLENFIKRLRLLQRSVIWRWRFPLSQYFSIVRLRLRLRFAVLAKYLITGLALFCGGKESDRSSSVGSYCFQIIWKVLQRNVFKWDDFSTFNQSFYMLQVLTKSKLYL